MIAYIDGKITLRDPAEIIIETAGIGYRLKISLNTYSAVEGKENCRLHTWMHIKEDAHTLYGFARREEKEIFLLLISISGVGPGTAIMMLSSMNPSELADAVAREDVAAVQQIKGVGNKTAQRIILELKDKIGKHIQSGTSYSASGHNTIRSEALTALMTLGLPRSSAEKSIENVLKSQGNQITLEELIKQALK